MRMCVRAHAHGFRPRCPSHAPPVGARTLVHMRVRQHAFACMRLRVSACVPTLTLLSVSVRVSVSVRPCVRALTWMCGPRNECRGAEWHVHGHVYRHVDRLGYAHVYGHVQGHVYRHAHRCAHRHVYRHMYRHAYRHVHGQTRAQACAQTRV